jgi:hypothetical protein
VGASAGTVQKTARATVLWARPIRIEAAVEALLSKKTRKYPKIPQHLYKNAPKDPRPFRSPSSSTSTSSPRATRVSYRISARWSTRAPSTRISRGKVCRSSSERGCKQGEGEEEERNPQEETRKRTRTAKRRYRSVRFEEEFVEVRFNGPHLAFNGRKRRSRPTCL